MNTKQFIAEFKDIASAPRSTQRLRGLILELAIQGDLLPISNVTEPASVLMKAIETHRASLTQQKETRRKTPIYPIDTSTLTLKIPAHWEIERLGNICEIIRGVTFPASQKQLSVFGDSVPCLRTTNIQAEIDWNDLIYIDAKLVGRDDQWIFPNDIIISMANSYELVGKVALARNIKQRATFGGFLAAIRPYLINPEYMYLLMRSPYMQSQMRGTANQTTNIANISLAGIYPIPVPIPPLEDQKLIVAKVNELMTLCDRLESQQQKLYIVCGISRKAALDDLATAQKLDAFVRGWHRFQDGMNLWLDTPDAVEDLRNAVGFLGCRGLLTEEMSLDDLPTSKDGRFSLPDGWSWVTLRDLAEYITSGSRGWRQYTAPQGDIFIRSQDIKHDALIFEERAFVNLPEQVEGKRTLVRPADLLITITGANVGKCAQVPTLSAKAYVSQHVALVRVRDTRHTPFLHWWITNVYGGRKYLARFIYGDKPGLNLPQVGSIPIPLPPQDVQDRIVKTLEHYAEICNRLSEQIKDARKLADLFAKSAVASITGVQIEEKKKMKTPKTELISNLRVGLSPANRDQAPLTAILIKNDGELPARSLWSISGLEIDDFYQQLKTEMANGWIVQPEVAYMKEVEAR